MTVSKANKIRKLADDYNIPLGMAGDLAMLAGYDFDLVRKALEANCYLSPQTWNAYIINKRFKRLEERNDSE